MSLDAKTSRLVKHGNVIISHEGPIRVFVDGFEGVNTAHRDVAALAMIWAIGELQRELLATIESPGGGSVGTG